MEFNEDYHNEMYKYRIKVIGFTIIGVILISLIIAGIK